MRGSDQSTSFTSTLVSAVFRAARSPVVIFVAAPALVIVAALALVDGLLARGEAYTQHVPLHIFAARSWAGGEIPTWNPYSFSGYPLLAVSQPGVFYPPAFLYLVISPALATNIYVLSSYFIAGTGAWFIARELSGDRLGAAVAAVAFPLSGFMVAHLGHPGMVASAAWLPWMLFGVERWRSRRSARFLILVAVAIAMAALAGHTQIFFVDLLVVGAYTVGIAVGGRRREWVRILGGTGGVTVLGVGLAALQLLPTLFILPHTHRAHMTFESATSYAFSPSHAPLLLFPYLFGGSMIEGLYAGPYTGQWHFATVAGYPGAAALVLAGVGALGLRRDRRLLVLGVVGVVMLAVAFGGSTPLARLVYALPIYGSFRAWGRYIFVVDLVVALLAACGVSRLRVSRLRAEANGTATRRAAGVVVLCFVGGGAAVLVMRSLRVYMPDGSPRLTAIAIPTAFAIGAFAWAMWGATSPDWSRAIVALVLVDAALSLGAFSSWTTSPDAKQLALDSSVSATHPWADVVDEPGGIDRILAVGASVYIVPPDLSGLSGQRSVIGGDPFAPRDYIQALGMTSSGWIRSARDLWPESSRVLDVLRVTTVVVNPTASNLDDLAPASDGRRLVAGNPGYTPTEPILRRYEYTPRLPEVFLVGRAAIAERSEVLAGLYGEEPFDPSAFAFVEGSCTRCPSGAPGPAGSVQRSDRSMTTLTAHVRASRPALVVVSEAWFPGWTATVDGEPAEVVRADGLVLGVPVDRGEHVVHLAYRAPGLRLGVAIAVASAALLLAASVVSITRQRRRVSRPSASISGSPAGDPRSP